MSRLWYECRWCGRISRRQRRRCRCQREGGSAPALGCLPVIVLFLAGLAVLAACVLVVPA